MPSHPHHTHPSRVSAGLQVHYLSPITSLKALVFCHTRLLIFISFSLERFLTKRRMRGHQICHVGKKGCQVKRTNFNYTAQVLRAFARPRSISIGKILSKFAVGTTVLNSFLWIKWDLMETFSAVGKLYCSGVSPNECSLMRRQSLFVQSTRTSIYFTEP